MSARDADRIFHETWLGLAQPFEGLVFSVPVLAEAQIAPAARPEITSQIRVQCEDLPSGGWALRSVRGFFESFLGYNLPGCIVERAGLPGFYAPESGQEVRASFGIARKPAVSDHDPFAEFAKPADTPSEDTTSNPIVALVWDLMDDSPAGRSIDLDKPETSTGPWHYPPTAKLERLLRHANIPVGFVSNRRELRLVYAPQGETTSHLTFRMDDLADPAGRPIALALELLFHANRTYGSDAKFTFEGLLAESRRRQADVTERLAEQVFDAVETLLAGFESAAARDCTAGRIDWMSAALRADCVHEGVLNTVLRLVFVLYAEDRSLLPVDHPLYAEHFSVLALYEKLVHDAAAHPESMHHRFGAYGALTTLFRAIYLGVRHGTLHLPPRQGKLFDPSVYPFLEGGLPDWTAAVNRADDRAQVLLPTIDDKTIHDVLHGLIVLDGQRLSYRDLSVEQIGAVYESLMGYQVLRVNAPAVRLGKNNVWVSIEELRKASKQEQKNLLEDRCDVSATTMKNVLAALSENQDDESAADAIAALAARKSQQRKRARVRQLVLQPTTSRRSTGSHYTPRSLSERVVRRTLEPVLACLGEAPAADLILQLKICDPAMGSGAFLVEACRFLSEQLVESWRRAGELPVMVEKHGEPLLYAKRLVAERCLYGVDKNAAAVELAKLSLWLETLSADKPFTFLDHVLRHGDSLVGLDLEQIRSFHWKPEKQLPTIAQLVDQVLAEVRDHREAILALAEDDSDTAQLEKRRLLELAELAMNRVKLVADACVGAFFAADKTKARDEERQRRRAVVETWLSGYNESQAVLEDWSREVQNKHAPFHWNVELPEIFFLERPDPLENGAANHAAFVDSVVGNPPFLPLAKIRSIGGPGYREWLAVLHPEVRDKSDLVAHFFRRAAGLLGRNGTLGFVATKTVTEGDTRDGGLRHLASKGFLLYSARSPFPWPGDASVTVVTVHLAAGRTRSFTGDLDLDFRHVAAINSSLEDRQERPEPARLSCNASLMLSGVRPYAEGFELTQQERESICAEDPRSAETIFTYVRGEAINAAPRAPTYIVWFRGMTLETAERFPAALAWVRQHVKPYRDGLLGTADDDWLRENWWRFHRDREELYLALSELRDCILLVRDPKHIVFTIGPANRVYNDKVFVIPMQSRTLLAVLQSRIHVGWAALQGRTTGAAGTPSYSSKRCFETFPFSQLDPRSAIPRLEAIGEQLSAERSLFMVGTNQGLTQTYNLLKDPKCDEPRILKLRELHEELDREVLDAYGWADLTVPPYCPLDYEAQRAVEQFQDAVIDRLFVLNAERAEEEKRLGAATPQKRRTPVKHTSSREAGRPAAQSQLAFGTASTEES